MVSTSLGESEPSPRLQIRIRSLPSYISLLGGRDSLTICNVGAVFLRIDCSLIGCLDPTSSHHHQQNEVRATTSFIIPEAISSSH